MSLAFVFSLIFFGISVVYVLYALYVMFLDMSSRINRLFFTLCGLLAIWTFSYAIANTAPDQSIGRGAAGQDLPVFHDC